MNYLILRNGLHNAEFGKYIVYHIFFICFSLDPHLIYQVAQIQMIMYFGYSLYMHVVSTSNFVGLSFFNFLLGILSQWLNIISTMSVAIFVVIVIGSITLFMLTLLVLCIITCTFHANDEDPNDEENSI